jgi:hypothetical protein
MKLISEDRTTELAAEALLRCLRDVPFLSVELGRDAEIEDRANTYRADILARVKSPASERVLIAEVKQSGQPRLARGAIDQLFRYTSLVPNAYGIFMAPYISPRAAELCTEAGIGYADLAGNCRLAFDQVYVRIEGNGNTRAARRDLRSLYSPRAERVLRALLVHPRRSWKLQELAAEVGVSLGQAFNVRKLLDSREWVTPGENGFTLSNPEALLGEWAQNYRYRRSLPREFYSMKSVPDIEADLAATCHGLGLRHALTGFSGAARYAAFVRYQRATAFVSDRIDDLARGMAIKEVPSGGNITLLAPYDEGVFYGAQQVGDDQVVAAAQCYLDVRSMAARGQEAAEALLERVIRPTW